MAKRPPVTLDASAFEAAAVKQPDPVAVAVAKAPPPAKAVPKPAQSAPVVVEAPKPSAVTETTSNSKQKSRAGLVAVQTWITPEKRKRLKILSIEQGRTMEELLEDAIDRMLK